MLKIRYPKVQLFGVYYSILKKGKIFRTVADLPRSGCLSKFTPRSDSPASVSILNVKVNDSTKPLFSKINVAAQLRLAKVKSGQTFRTRLLEHCPLSKQVKSGEIF